MLSTSQRAPGYAFQYQVPPTSGAASRTATLRPCCRRRCSMYIPENPAPMTMTSKRSSSIASPGASLPSTRDIALLLGQGLNQEHAWSDACDRRPPHKHTPEPLRLAAAIYHGPPASALPGGGS